MRVLSDGAGRCRRTPSETGPRRPAAGRLPGEHRRTRFEEDQERGEDGSHHQERSDTSRGRTATRISIRSRAAQGRPSPPSPSVRDRRSGQRTLGRPSVSEDPAETLYTFGSDLTVRVRSVPSGSGSCTYPEKNGLSTTKRISVGTTPSFSDGEHRPYAHEKIRTRSELM